MRWMAIRLVSVALATVAASSSAQGACFPACREGYVGYEGACVTACNPPCAAGECAKISPKVQPAPTEDETTAIRQDRDR